MSTETDIKIGLCIDFRHRVCRVLSVLLCLCNVNFLIDFQNRCNSCNILLYIVSRSSDSASHRPHLLQSHGLSELRRNICVQISDAILRCHFVCRGTRPVVSRSVSTDRSGTVLEQSLLPTLRSFVSVCVCF